MLDITPRILDKLPRIQLTDLPTPLQEAKRLSQALGGPRIFLKRDDLTGLGLGGNKVRKLEYLIADAIQHGADTVITTGAAQSNHARQTAAAAAAAGLRCILVLNEPTYAVESPQGNVLLDRLFGAELRFIPADATLDEQNRAMDEAAADVRRAGHTPYIVAMGGSSPLGTVGYIRAALELRHQLFERNIDADAVFVSSGSGGTQAGLIAGKLLQDVQWRIIGISPSKPKAVIQERVRTNVAGVIDLLKLPVSFDPNQIEVRDDFIGPGYGVPTPAGVEAIRLVARTEGLLLDPVYTSKAMAGMIAAIRRGEFNHDQTLVFCMTGGIPALFALNREILALVEQE